MAPGNGGPLSFLASIYDLDTLDTRFTTPSSVPYKAAVADARGSGADKRGDSSSSRTTPDKRAEPSKWGTVEFWFYYLVFLTVVPYMFWIAYDVSRRGFPLFFHLFPKGVFPSGLGVGFLLIAVCARAGSVRSEISQV